MDTLYQIALTQIPGVGDVTAKKLLAGCGTLEQLFKEKKQNLLRIPDIGPCVTEKLISHKQEALQIAEKELKFIEKHNIRVLFYTDPVFPERLKHCSDSPVLLYYKGNADLNKKHIVSIVGTRKSTEYGKALCEQLLHDLSQEDILIVSGLAYGIDALAHKNALKYHLPTVS